MKKVSPFTIEWEAPEHEHKQRSADWFWATGILTISAAVASFIFGNVIFGIFILLAAFSLALFINREPEIISVHIDERGVTRGNLHYPYSTLEAFWIDTEHAHPKIMLRSKKSFLPLIIIPLNPESDAESVAEALAKHLTEEHHALPLVERLIEYLGF